MNKLAAAVQRDIKTCGRLSGLSIEVVINCKNITLLGRCRSYYEKSLIGEAAKKAVKNSQMPDVGIRNDVEVLEN